MKIDTLPMDQVERVFVNNFLIDERRDRALYELNSKKRRNFFSRLSRDDSRLKPECVQDISKCEPQKGQDEILAILQTKGSEKTCYLMSYIREIDRQFVSLEDGLLRCLQSPMGTVLVCGSNLAFIQGERVASSPPRMILHCPRKRL